MNRHFQRGRNLAEVSLGRRPDWTRLDLATALFVLGFVCFYALYVLNHSDFSNDDFVNMLLMRRSGFWSFVFTPIVGGHITPIHRLLTALAYHVSPMSFGVTVMISAALHVATILYLYRLLRLLGVGEASRVVVCCYAAAMLPLFAMIWWANAEHRFPYVFCAVFAAFHYVTWLRKEGRWHVAACVLAYIIGLASYEKAVLIPVQMVAIAFFSAPARFIREWRRSLVIPVVLGSFSLLYVGAYLAFDPAAQEHPSAALAGTAIVEFIKMLGTSIVGLPVRGMEHTALIGWSASTLLASALWAAFIGFSVARCRRCVWTWLGLLVLLCLDCAPIAISDRIVDFGLVEPHSYRFGFEEMFVVAVFLGLIVKQSFRPVQSSDWPARKLVGLLFVTAYALGNMWRVGAIAQHSPGLKMQASAHGYMRHLRHDMAALAGSSPGFEPSPMPSYMNVVISKLDAGTVAYLIDPTARFGLSAEAAGYRIDEYGFVRSLPLHNHEDRQVRLGDPGKTVSEHKALAR